MKKLSLLMLAVLALTGCATKFAYNNLDWILDSFVDDYIELDRRQERSFDISIIKVQQWHKKEELPRYVDQSGELIALTSREVTATDIEMQIEQFQQHWQRLIEKTEPELYRLSKSVDNQQLDFFLGQLEQQNRKYLKRVNKQTEQERIDSRYERYTEWVSKWLGPLHTAQKKELRWLAEQQQPSMEDWIDQRRRWSAELTRLSEMDRTSEEYREKFRALMVNADSLQSEQHKQKIAMNRELWIGSMTNLLNSMTNPQREHLRKKIAGWQETFDDLQTHTLPLDMPILTARVWP